MRMDDANEMMARLAKASMIPMITLMINPLAAFCAHSSQAASIYLIPPKINNGTPKITMICKNHLIILTKSESCVVNLIHLLI